MIVLGLNGCLDLPNASVGAPAPPWFFHDAAASLVIDGRLVAAVEEERLTRIKHTNTFPAQAITACLDIAGIGINDLDEVAFFFEEAYTDKELFHQYVEHPETPLRSVRDLLLERLDGLGGVAPEALLFVAHHDAHAASAYVDSGVDDSLVVVMDGNGETESMTLYSASAGTWEVLQAVPTTDSIGHLYTRGTELLGYRLFEEYKVMGLAPYGDAARYRGLFEGLYELDDEGRFHVASDRIRTACAYAGFRPRRSGSPISQEHKDFAAALQEATERIATHVISHWQQQTGHRHLSIAGGVGQNSTLNGKLLRSGIVNDVFVHPAAHDSGASYGAALVASHRDRPFAPKRSRSVFLGRDLPTNNVIEQILQQWSLYVTYERLDDVELTTAELLASGKVVGWVQGRSEFGPRALGHRSILADPRPAENRSHVNRMIKQREGYRPFAPSVCVEDLHTYFEYPEDVAPTDFMVFTAQVRNERRQDLGAVTHVDGSARVHPVDREVDERFWTLLREFERHSGVPILLNTSFNNHAEPIVDSVYDAVVCYLTTALDILVVGDWLVTKRTPALTLCPALRLSLAQGVQLRTMTVGGSTEYYVASTHMHGRSREIDADTHALLVHASSPTSLADLGVTQPGTVAETVIALWRDRFVHLEPPPVGTADGVTGLEGAIPG
jgi:predicted NodU family carbamoyl transferase